MGACGSLPRYFLGASIKKLREAWPAVSINNSCNSARVAYDVVDSYPVTKKESRSFSSSGPNRIMDLQVQLSPPFFPSNQLFAYLQLTSGEKILRFQICTSLQPPSRVQKMTLHDVLVVTDSEVLLCFFSHACQVQ